MTTAPTLCSCNDPDCRGEQLHVPGSVTARVAPAHVAPSTVRALNAQAAGKRRALDDYPTPEWVIRAIAPHVAGATVLDPCCGAGAILDVFADRGAVVRGIEIGEERAAEASAKGHEVVAADALAVDWPAVDLIITNPPFSRMQGFVEKALASVKPSGTVAMLGRLGFLEGKKRLAFHRANGSSVYVLASRPSFSGNGKTDASAYGWYVWGPRHTRTLHFLDAVDPGRRSRTPIAIEPEKRPIPGAPGYLASADGKIYSTWRRARTGRQVVSTPDGEPSLVTQFDRNEYNPKTRVCEPTPYRTVKIWREGGKRTSEYVHMLVALAFLGPRPEGHEICHGPKGSECNDADNLRYGTPEENAAERALSRGDDWHRARGLRPPGIRDPGPCEFVDDALTDGEPLGEVGLEDLLEAGQ